MSQLPSETQKPASTASRVAASGTPTSAIHSALLTSCQNLPTSPPLSTDGAEVIRHARWFPAVDSVDCQVYAPGAEHDHTSVTSPIVPQIALPCRTRREQHAHQSQVR